MARRAHSKVTRFPGGSHLTLISHPDAVTSVIGSAICSRTIGGSVHDHARFPSPMTSTAPGSDPIVKNRYPKVNQAPGTTIHQGRSAFLCEPVTRHGLTDNP